MQFPKKRKSDEFKKRDDGPVHLTKDGFKSLQEKLERLKLALPEFINEAKRTAAYGDRSDNAEYKEAKSILRRTHRQILNIEDQIRRAVIIASGSNSSGAVQLGSIVVLEIDGAQKTFQILGSHESNPANGRISYQSPLGSALMGHIKGDIVTVQTASGSKKYCILEIR
jgi:transcription elongation factor GreA